MHTHGPGCRRYEANVESSDGPKDWSSADRYYRHAALVYPAGGNAHNQLAVLATYLADDRSAVYHYFRSLAVTEPFLIARENLLLLFEQNRKRWELHLREVDARRGCRCISACCSAQLRVSE